MLSDPNFQVSQIRENIAPLVPIDGMNEWLEEFIESYFNDLERKTFDPIIKRSAKLYAYWSLLNFLVSVNEIDEDSIEYLKRSINNELAWAITITLEMMPDLNVDGGRLQTQAYFDLFKEVLIKQKLEIGEIQPFLLEETLIFSFSTSQKVEEIEQNIFEKLLLSVAEVVFDVNAECFNEIADGLRQSKKHSNEERQMAALSLIADNFFIQNILHKEYVSKCDQSKVVNDLLEYIFPRDAYWKGVKNILENIESYGFDSVNYTEEWLEGRGHQNFIKITFMSDNDQDQVWQFFEKVNAFRKMHQDVMPPLPNIYDQNTGLLMRDTAQEYIDNINDAFNGVVSEVKIPQEKRTFKVFSIEN